MVLGLSAGRRAPLCSPRPCRYGFTGAGASMLRCVELADACLSIGSAACHHAREVILSRPAAAAGAAAAEAAAPDAGREAMGDVKLSVVYGQTDSLFVVINGVGADHTKAAAVGECLARLVSTTLPSPMRLVSERLLAPFLLVHVNRYAGVCRSGHDEALLIKGVRSEWRREAPVVRRCLRAVVAAILSPGGVESACAVATSHISDLLTHKHPLIDYVMTGGLWRISGEEVDAAADRAVEAGEDGEGQGLIGPHVSLAARQRMRDRGRRHVLGERLGYVLLAGYARQDEAAEDALTALRRGQKADTLLYWERKLKSHLVELLHAAHASPADVHFVLNGPHTHVRRHVGRAVAPLASTTAEGAPADEVEPMVAWTCPRCTLDNATAATTCAACAGPRPHGAAEPTTWACDVCTFINSRQNTTKCAMCNSPRTGKSRRTGGPAVRRLPSLRRQAALDTFLTAAPSSRCGVCGHALDAAAAGSLLCGSCEGLGGLAIMQGYTKSVQALRASERRHAVAWSVCAGCQAGGSSQLVLCENGECEWLYERFAADDSLHAAHADHSRWMSW